MPRANPLGRVRGRVRVELVSEPSAPKLKVELRESGLWIKQRGRRRQWSLSFTEIWHLAQRQGVLDFRPLNGNQVR